MKKSEGLTALYLKTVREELGITKGKLATITGIKRTTIVMMEKELMEPKFDATMTLLKALGKDINDMKDFYESKGFTL